MLLNERALLEKKRLTEENRRIAEQIRRAPDGLLRCRKAGNTYKWYTRKTDPSGHAYSTYLTKKERHVAEELARKTFRVQKLKDNEKEIAAIEAYLKRHPAGGGKSVLMKDHPAFSGLLQSRELDKELTEWTKEEYEKNPAFSEHLNVRASTGEMVRSKSEAFILSSLATAGIPFRYECRFVLGQIVIYPDFLIRRPADGNLVIWEHFGLMSDPVYLRKAQEKIRLYIQNGFYPMKNLFTTFEDGENSLDFSQVLDLVELLRDGISR